MTAIGESMHIVSDGFMYFWLGLGFAGVVYFRVAEILKERKDRNVA